MQNLSFIEWLRQINNNLANPKPYKDGTTLVSLKTVSPINNEYFFQELLMYYPHRPIAELKTAQFDEMPKQIQFFASLIELMQEKWNNDEVLRQHIRRQGNKEYFVDTIMAYFALLRDILYMWKREFVTTGQLTL